MLQLTRTMRQYLKLFSGRRFTLSSSQPIIRNVSISTKTKNARAEFLDDRGILRVSGEDASVFMQGLITNDMRHLEEGAPSMYAMFLNNKGRVMYDTIIYKSKEENVFLIECDKSALPQLQKHLRMFRIRKQVDIDNLEEQLKVWVIFDPKLGDPDNETTADEKAKSVLHGQIISGTKDSVGDELLVEDKSGSDVIVCRDPRLSLLGARLLAPANENVSLQYEEQVLSQKAASYYRVFRYRLGVGEGVNDLPPGNCFPLEANGDYLHGVSFHKGCYIGQELTARTHHTGVVRKRLMPLFFDSVPQSKLEVNTPIQLPSGTNKASLGKLRGVEQNVGLALLRVAEVLDVSKLKILDVTAQTTKPHWWPQEAPKERALVGKA